MARLTTRAIATTVRRRNMRACSTCQALNDSIRRTDGAENGIDDDDDDDGLALELGVVVRHNLPRLLRF